MTSPKEGLADAPALALEDLIRAGDFEQIQVLNDRESGLFGFLAIHSTRLGPAFGGIRRRPYPSVARALQDALRLAEHMTLKCAIQGIPGGGGKVVLIDEGQADRAAAYRRLGDFVQAMGGRYYTGPDVGTEPQDLLAVGERTRFVALPPPGGDEIHGAIGDAVGDASGDTSGDGTEPCSGLGEATALGVFAGLRAVAARVGRQDLAGAHVVVTGLGEVGWKLAAMLAAAGARLTVADIVAERVERAVRELGAVAVAPENAHTVACDVLAPCAMGGVVSAETVSALRTRAIAGSANNVLATPDEGPELHRRGILFAPDFVVNSGGLLHGALTHLQGEPPPRSRIEAIGDLVTSILEASTRADVSPEVLAERMARERVDRAPHGIFSPDRS